MNQKKSNHNLVLLYHEVTDYPEQFKTTRHIDPAYSLSVERFNEQIEFLHLSSTHSVMSLDDLLNAARVDNGVVISFDDGLIGNYRHAFEILQNFQCPATFFISVRDIGTVDFMSWEQLQELARYGHSIQSHTLSHPMLAYCSSAQIRQELEKSKQIIEDKIGKPVIYLSFPFGSFNETVLKLAQDTGYEAAFTSRIETIQQKSHRFYHGRIPIKSVYSIETFSALLNPGTATFKKTQNLNRIKDQIKSLVGLENYRRIYRFVNRIELS